MSKSIIIVGAGPGVGYETAKKYGNEGYKVGLINILEPVLVELKEELEQDGITVYYETADASNTNELGHAIDRLIEQLGGLTTYFYNVPGPLGKSYMPMTEAPESLFSLFLQLRVTSVLSSIQHVLPSLEKSQGSILISSGQSDRIAYPFTGIMGTAQAALKMLMTHLSQELKEKKIFVGYFPLDNPPVITDEKKEAKREDLPGGFELTKEMRITAKDVAEEIFKEDTLRENFDVRIQKK
jgi:NADP-dependent 3-hydroxy acid dehydrogenase YdfG